MSETTGAQRWAVLIGVDRYHESLGNLRYSGQDCRRLADVLTRGDDAVPPDHLLVLCDDAPAERRPTYANIHSWLASWLSQPDDDDAVLVFFAGHGREMGGTGYLVPADATLDTLHVTGIPIKYVQELLGRCKASQKLLVLDACHSGAGRDVAPMPEGVIEQLEDGRGITTLTSCDVDEVSHEWDEKGHGVFSYFLAEALEGGCPPDAQGRVTADAVYTWVHDRVRRWAAQHRCRQTPRRLTEGTGLMTLRRARPDWKNIALDMRREIRQMRREIEELKKRTTTAPEPSIGRPRPAIPASPPPLPGVELPDSLQSLIDESFRQKPRKPFAILPSRQHERVHCSPLTQAGIDEAFSPGSLPDIVDPSIDGRAAQPSEHAENETDSTPPADEPEPTTAEFKVILVPNDAVVHYYLDEELADHEVLAREMPLGQHDLRVVPRSYREAICRRTIDVLPRSMQSLVVRLRSVVNVRALVGLLMSLAYGLLIWPFAVGFGPDMPFHYSSQTIPTVFSAMVVGLPFMIFPFWAIARFVRQMGGGKHLRIYASIYVTSLVTALIATVLAFEWPPDAVYSAWALGNSLLCGALFNLAPWPKDYYNSRF